MTKDRRYRNPSVVEALCEIYLRDSACDETVPGQFYDRVKQEFSVKRQTEIPGETAFLLDLYNLFQPSEPFALETIQRSVKTAHENIITAFEGSITDALRTLFRPEEGA